MKIIGLKRNGKSCRLRWVNYLNPGLKRGKMTPQEECRILELHTKWGNRWSKIAQKLPGRTDNEIKNYWRTHMRKKAQEKKRTLSPSISFSDSSAYSSVTSNPTYDIKARSFYDAGGLEMATMTNCKGDNYDTKSTVTSTNILIAGHEDGYDSMDEVWKDIALLDADSIRSAFGTYNEIVPPSIWDYSLNTLWMIDGQEEIGSNMFL